jgi:hypothetical protein
MMWAMRFMNISAKFINVAFAESLPLCTDVTLKRNTVALRKLQKTAISMVLTPAKEKRGFHSVARCSPMSFS